MPIMLRTNGLMSSVSVVLTRISDPTPRARSNSARSVGSSVVVAWAGWRDPLAAVGCYLLSTGRSRVWAACWLLGLARAQARTAAACSRQM